MAFDQEAWQWWKQALAAIPPGVEFCCARFVAALLRGGPGRAGDAIWILEKRGAAALIQNATGCTHSCARPESILRACELEAVPRRAKKANCTTLMIACLGSRCPAIQGLPPLLRRGLIHELRHERWGLRRHEVLQFGFVPRPSRWQFDEDLRDDHVVEDFLESSDPVWTYYYVRDRRVQLAYAYCGEDEEACEQFIVAEVTRFARSGRRLRAQYSHEDSDDEEADPAEP